jgi:beta-N-acetylhexosaminidase
LFMMPVYSNQNLKYEENIFRLVEQHNIGGIILMQGSPSGHVQFTNTLQKHSKVPLMVAIDGEWGVAMRVDSINPYPKAMALGAIQNDQLIYDLGQQIAFQCKRMGIHINFGPVLDINTQYNNPIINMRSFGNVGKNVARKGLAYAMGMQNNGVMAVGKHFPGHGSTFTDSHKTLPVVYASKEQLLYKEIFPFENLIQNELGGVMVAHIAYPSLDARVNRPASLSVIVIDSILKKRIGFKGLVFTDALNMKGVTKYFKPGQIEVEALIAGNDILLYPENVDAGVNAIVNAIKEGIILEKEINDKCKKVLKAKQWFGLDNYKAAKIKHLLDEINTVDSKKLNQQLIEASITLVQNRNGLLPLKQLENKRILCLSMGGKNKDTFFKYLQRYARVDTLSCSKWTTEIEAHEILDTLTYYTHVIVGHMGISEWPFRQFNMSKVNIELAQKIAEKKSTVLCMFGNPYALRYYNSAENFSSILIAYNDQSSNQKVIAEAVFGGIDVSGTLPISVNEKLKSGNGLFYNTTRLKYSDPYEFTLSDTAFYKIDSIAQSAIDIKATPGCQIIYVKDGKVVYDKTFGFHTYQKNKGVKWYDIYDIASVTKVASTTLSLMKMYEDNLFDPAAKLSKYFTELIKTDKKSVRINQVMAHHSGFRSWIPFYRNTLTDEGELRADLYSKDSMTPYSIKVARDLYLRNDYVDSVYQAIIDTPLYHKKKYRYSDQGFYWLAKLINKQTGQPINEYVNKIYYSPLGMNNTFYNAWKYKNEENIIPTENDKNFRKQIVRGYVHDQGAALLGGVSGHAGLFSNANDLAKLGQLLLNQGYYGEIQYFSSKTLAVFNKSYFKRKGNRRALGFDKPALKLGDPGPTCRSASQASFGHSGFTGAYFWVDPENQSVFVFLSNRTFPSQENNKLVELNIRTHIHQEFYNVFEH